jgi:hypothetical protein
VTVLVEPAAAGVDVSGSGVLAGHAGAVEQAVARGLQTPAAAALARAGRAVAELAAVWRLALEWHCVTQRKF